MVDRYVIFIGDDNIRFLQLIRGKRVKHTHTWVKDLRNASMLTNKQVIAFRRKFKGIYKLRIDLHPECRYA